MDLTKDALCFYDESALYNSSENEEPESWEYDVMVEDCIEALNDWIKKVAGDVGDYFYAWINDFGWTNASGFKTFYAKNGAELLNAILPKTQNTYYVYEDKENEDKNYLLRVLNYHHDSPTGETYYIRLATEKEKEGM